MTNAINMVIQEIKNYKFLIYNFIILYFYLIFFYFIY